MIIGKGKLILFVNKVISYEYKSMFSFAMSPRDRVELSLMTLYDFRRK